MFKDFIDLSILKYAQPGFSSQIVSNSLPQKVKHPNFMHKYLFSRFQAEIFMRNNVAECIQNWKKLVKILHRILLVTLTGIKLKHVAYTINSYFIHGS